MARRGQPPPRAAGRASGWDREVGEVDHAEIASRTRASTWSGVPPASTSADPVGEAPGGLREAVGDGAWKSPSSASIRSGRGPRRAAAGSVSEPQQERAVGLQAAGANRWGQHLVDAEAAGDALVGQRGVDEAVGHHVGAALQRGPDDVLRPAARGRRRRASPRRAEPICAAGSSSSSRIRSPAGVPPGSRTRTTALALGLEGVCQEPRLSRLARSRRGPRTR